MMQATDFEFRNRWTVFGCIFGLSFFVFMFDNAPAGLRLAAPLLARGWHQRPAYMLIFGISAALMVAAALLRTWGSAYLGHDTVHDASLHSDTLKADGPYRFVRNPLYLGNIIMAAGFAIMAPRAGSVFMLIAIPIFCMRLIGREEAALAREQGQTFEQYMRTVPRILPALSPRAVSTGFRADWTSGFATEAFIWSFAFGVIAFAITLNTMWFYGGLVLSPVMRWAAGKALHQRTPKASTTAN